MKKSFYLQQTIKFFGYLKGLLMGFYLLKRIPFFHTSVQIFTIKNAPEDVLKKILLIECPKFLFPFLRTIIGNSTRDGGFPPLMITPIDFVALFESKNKNNTN